MRHPWASNYKGHCDLQCHEEYQVHGSYPARLTEEKAMNNLLCWPLNALAPGLQASILQLYSKTTLSRNPTAIVVRHQQKGGQTTTLLNLPGR